MSRRPAASPRPPSTPLGWLLAEPRRFTFDAAVRVLTFHRRRADPADAARFGSAAGSAFPGAEVTEVEVGPRSGEARMTVGLMGLTGPAGVLPRHYSDAVIVDQRSRSFSLSRFLELISHRMIGAFAAAGMKYRAQRAADTTVLTPNRPSGDPTAEALLALSGYATPGLIQRLPAGASALRHYAGLFSAHPRSADRLAALASDWLGRPVTVEQFVGAWIAVPPDQRTRMPMGLAPGAFSQLGRDAAAGIRAWDQQGRIVLRIGPLDLPYFQRLLPDRPLLRELVSLVRAFVGFEIGFAVNPVLHRDEVPALILGNASAGVGGARLGWNTWLPMPPGVARRQHASEAVYEAEIVEGLT